MKKQNLKFWNMLRTGENMAQITIYGEIRSSKSDWSDPESQITHIEFAKELDALGDVSEIVVRINSGGGDVFAANAIYTRLRDHKAKITVKIDGYAASAATTIAMAGDEIFIPENGWFMVHEPRVGVSGYLSKTECEELGKTVDTIKKGMIATYRQRTGKTEEEIADIMSAETWYTGKEAVEAGFCDALLFQEEGEEGEDMVANNLSFVALDLGKYENCPEELKLLCNHRQTSNFTGELDGDFTNKTKNKEVKNLKTLAELKAQYPELVAQLEQEAIMSERQRIQNIEEIAISGYETMAQDAKFVSGIQASELAVQIMAQQKKQGVQYLADRQADVTEGNVGTEAAAKLPQEDKSAQNQNDAMDVVNKMLEEKFK